MKYFTTVNDIADAKALVKEALTLKQAPFNHSDLGKNKTLGLLFFNASLRTRMSTQKAAQHLGMHVIVMNVGNESWTLEYEEGAIMNGTTVEHIQDAASVIGLYCDIVAVRCFPTLANKKEDYHEKILLQFIKYCHTPLVSMESATLHPLQSLADMMTIKEYETNANPKVVLTWAPHVKALPQVVPNSFAEWALRCGYNLTITHPEGYALCEDFTRGANMEPDQQKALQGADFVYVKNWSSFSDYGQVLPVKEDWLLNRKKMEVTNAAKIMHCLPLRRNVELPDELVDGSDSLILQQAANRVFAAQTVLKKILECNFTA